MVSELKVCDNTEKLLKDTVVFMYLGGHLRILSAFTLAQTSGSTSFHPLTPETFAVVVAAHTHTHTH